MVDNFRDLIARFLAHGAKRNLWSTFGYPHYISLESYWLRYRRGGIATRIVRAYPDACWRFPPVVQDEQGSSQHEGEEYSAFTDAWVQLCDRLNVYEYLRRLDRLSRVGHYAVLLLGFDDSKSMHEPVEGRPLLRYLSAYSERSAKVIEWDTNPQSERFGLPLAYQVSVKSDSQASNVFRRTHFRVHWTRVMHVAENLDEDEIYGEPALRPVWNHLLDLEKVLGSGAETFWLNARGGVSVDVHPDAKVDEATIASMKKQMDDYMNDLRRDLAMQGAKVNLMSTPVADPKGNVEVQERAIAGTTGIPVRILSGSERGELASTQDANSFSARVDERCRNHCSPNILRVFVDLMIFYGNLPEPMGEWTDEWIESSALSEKERVELALKRVQAASKWASTPADQVIALPELRIDLGMNPQSEYELGEPKDADDLGIGIDPLDLMGDEDEDEDEDPPNAP